MLSRTFFPSCPISEQPKQFQNTENYFLAASSISQMFKIFGLDTQNNMEAFFYNAPKKMKDKLNI